MIIAYFLFVLFSSIVEGFLWDRQGTNGKKLRDIHVWLVLMRSTVFLMLYLSLGWEWVLFAVFSFPLLHDGVYYQTRNFLNPLIYHKGFFDTSKTSTALFTVSFKWRLLMAVLGVFFLFFLSASK